MRGCLVISKPWLRKLTRAGAQIEPFYDFGIRDWSGSRGRRREDHGHGFDRGRHIRIECTESADNPYLIVQCGKGGKRQRLAEAVRALQARIAVLSAEAQEERSGRDQAEVQHAPVGQRGSERGMVEAKHIRVLERERANNEVISAFCASANLVNVAR